MSAGNRTLTSDEHQRLAALRSYRVVGARPEAETDHIARFAADLFEAPIALISFVADEMQYFKARVGLDTTETPRDVSFCAHALTSEEVLVIPDARQDARFANNPLVTGAPFIRFYAGAPLTTQDGYRIGSLCIIDSEVRQPLTQQQTQLLKGLAQIAIDHLEKSRLESVQHAFLNLASATPDAIVCADEKGFVTFWNTAAERIFGRDRSEAMSQPVDIIVPPECRAALAKYLTMTTGSSSSEKGGLVGQRKDGTQFPIETSFGSWRDGESTQTGLIVRDLTEKHRVEACLNRISQYDRLTGLPNRTRFIGEIDAALQNNEKFAVYKIGLDKFKSVNGSLGMAAGDLVLRMAAERVIALSSPGDTVARIGADEFGLLKFGECTSSGIKCVIDRLLSVLSSPFTIHGSRCRLSASIGVVLSEQTPISEDAQMMLKSGLLALNRAKETGGGRAEIFEPSLGRQAAENHRLVEDLREAVIGEQFELYYQPQVSLRDRRIIGVEALLRWRHPAKGLLTPADFLSVLEVSASCIEVGRWVLKTASAFGAELAAGGKPIRMGVNLFANQLKHDTFYKDVTSTLLTTNLSPSLLELEITETTALTLDSNVIDPLHWLRDLGVRIAFDDYGTGFASLSLLKRYPLTRLKIDREFVRDLERDPGDVAIVKAVLSLGRSFGIEVIAEGIETVEQSDILQSFGCGEAQGFLFGKPMPAMQLKELLEGQKARYEAA